MMITMCCMTGANVLMMLSQYGMMTMENLMGTVGSIFDMIMGIPSSMGSMQYVGFY